jgi:hypothetical protein
MGLFQTSSPPGGVQFAAPNSGVITSWAIWLGGDTPDAVRFKVARPAGPSAVQIVGVSGFQLVNMNRVNSFGVRIPVEPGDVIGFNLYGESGQSVACGRGAAGYETSVEFSDTARGQTTSTSPLSNLELPVSAQLEPDADGDNYGDETQDECPTDGLTQEPCVDRTAPQTRITKRPGKKTKSKRAKFKFTASEADSTFSCSLDGRAFRKCTSPHKVKVKPGRHTFVVVASDAAGNLDKTPAMAAWTVKEKRRRR